MLDLCLFIYSPQLLLLFPLTKVLGTFILVYGSEIIRVYAQSDLQTVKYRNLVIDLINGVNDNTQLILLLKGTISCVLVLSLCCYIEYWGKLLLVKPEDGARKVLNAFFKKLGAKYKD